MKTLIIIALALILTLIILLLSLKRKNMNFNQSTIGEILDSEKEMFLKGAERYGECFINAADFNHLLNEFIESVQPTHFLFATFLSQVRKHHTLALFSAVRLHHIQTGMDMRQVLENGSWAAYAIAHTETEKFYTIDANGLITYPKKLKEAKNNWLEQNFKHGSDHIKHNVKLIGDTTAHANIVYAMQNFKFDAKNEKFETPFFDFEHDLKVKTDLWMIGNAAMGLMDLFYGVNKSYNVIKFIDNFIQRLKNLEKQNDKLKNEIMNGKNFKSKKKN